MASVHPGPERGRHMETRSKKDEIDLPGIAHWLSGWPANQRVVGSIPSQGTCLDCGPGPQEGVCKRQLIDIISCTSMFLSLSPSLPLSLKINKIFKK